MEILLLYLQYRLSLRSSTNILKIHKDPFILKNWIWELGTDVGPNRLLYVTRTWMKIDSLMLIGIRLLFIIVHVPKCLKYRNAQNKHRNKTTGLVWILYSRRKMPKRGFILDSLPHCSVFQQAWLSKFIQPSGSGHYHILQGILGNELQTPNTMNTVLFVSLVAN